MRLPRVIPTNTDTASAHEPHNIFNTRTWSSDSNAMKPLKKGVDNKTQETTKAKPQPSTNKYTPQHNQSHFHKTKLNQTHHRLN